MDVKDAVGKGLDQSGWDLPEKTCENKQGRVEFGNVRKEGIAPEKAFFFEEEYGNIFFFSDQEYACIRFI